VRGPEGGPGGQQGDVHAGGETVDGLAVGVEAQELAIRGDVDLVGYSVERAL